MVNMNLYLYLLFQIGSCGTVDVTAVVTVVATADAVEISDLRLPKISVGAAVAEDLRRRVRENDGSTTCLVHLRTVMRRSSFLTVEAHAEI